MAAFACCSMTLGAPAAPNAAHNGNLIDPGVPVSLRRSASCQVYAAVGMTMLNNRTSCQITLTVSSGNSGPMTLERAPCPCPPGPSYDSRLYNARIGQDFVVSVDVIDWTGQRHLYAQVTHHVS